MAGIFLRIKRKLCTSLRDLWRGACYAAALPPSLLRHTAEVINRVVLRSGWWPHACGGAKSPKIYPCRCRHGERKFRHAPTFLYCSMLINLHFTLTRFGRSSSVLITLDFEINTSKLFVRSCTDVLVATVRSKTKFLSL